MPASRPSSDSSDPITEGLEQLRKRLLDLSRRNKLLNFKHSNKSSLRVVDELPDELFRALRDGCSLIFRPVPEPRRERQEETNDVYTLPLIPQSDSNEKEKTDPRTIKAKEHAAKLGINTSYDLPVPTSQSNPRHSDKYIQTLHYPSELEAILRRINTSARTAIEESGTNMLYLVFGFLEWYESNDSSDPIHSPLLTQPVELTREKPSRAYGGMYEFSLDHTGEDLLTNLSLSERLKRDFSLSVPELEGEDTPETYFKKFSSILKEQPRWRIRRYVTLTLLQFGKLLMFLDLDSSRHPSILASPRVNELLGAKAHDSEPVDYCETYELDCKEAKQDLPAIIYDADSSQHSALIDALRGKNLVIEGPPGTGKSQTITNLITAFLAEGKSVLFVSEKLAALEVVRRRMDQAGLGDFCLELHSHKTKKDRFLQDIRQRIAKQKTFRDANDLEGRLAFLEKSKKELIDYVQIINSPFGQTDKTIFDILWARDNFLQRSPTFSSLEDRLSLRHADELTPTQKEHGRFAIEIYQQQLSSLLKEHRSVAGHPWQGVKNGDLTYVQQREVVNKLERLDLLLNQLGLLLADINAAIGTSIPPSVKSLNSLTKSLPVFPKVEKPVIVSLLGRLKDESVRKTLERFLRDLAKYKREREELVQSFTELSIPLGSPDEVTREIIQLRSRNVRKCTKSALLTAAAHVKEVLTLSTNFCRLISETGQRFSADIKLDWDSVRLLRDTLDTLQRTNWDILDLRNGSLNNPALGPVRKQAFKKAEDIRRQQDILSKEYVLARLPSSDELWRHATSISSSSLWSRLWSSEYKQARICYATIRKTSEKAKWDVMAVDLKELAEYQDSIKAFSSDKQYRDAFGECFNGLDTPFHEIAAVLKWYADLRDAFVKYDLIGEALQNSFKTLSRETLHEAKEFLISNVPSLESVEKLKTLIDGLPFGQGKACGSLTLLQLIDHLTDLSSTFEHAIKHLGDLPIAEHVTIDEIPELLERREALSELEAALNGSPQVSTLLGERYQGCLTESQGLIDTMQLVESLACKAIPVEIQEWLLTSDFVSRLGWLSAQLEKTESLLSLYTALWKEFVELTDLDIESWYSDAAKDWKGFSLDLLSSRLRCAIEGALHLSQWVDYLRAVRELQEFRLGEIVALAEEGCLKDVELKDAYEFSVYNGLCNLIFDRYPKLLNFSRNRHERVRGEFARLDAEIISLYRNRAAFNISGREVPRGCGTGPVRDYTDLSLLQHEIQKQRGHIPIRSLLNRARSALLSLKPCFMMGPMSVAQYLRPGDFHFDLVVMDEASQLKPEEAIGAIARGSQVVIVGDPKQLPPTSYFDTLFIDPTEDHEEDDSLAIEESESILDRGCEVYRPIRQLRWHYRSRHESLIAFSNHRFYDSNLILFPSPHKEHPSLGIKHRFIENGRYQGRVNRIEAELVVDEILKHMEHCQNESLGVATFNSTQRDLIEELFDSKAKTDLNAQSYLAKWKDGAEPFFIKNLETVQGDERDCIFVSFTYGRDDHGNMYQRFGPINGANGHRRLNVLLTRAKLRTVIFTSMRSEDVKIQEESSLGLKAMRASLAFAETGILEQPIVGNGPEPNEFEMSVGSAVKNLGLEVVPQVGVAGYFIDLAVCHPKRPGAYILGIECDGATYHSAKSARDRDRLRESNLRNLGWEIHRVWSTDWHKNRKLEIDRIQKRVQQLLSNESSAV